MVTTEDGNVLIYRIQDKDNNGLYGKYSHELINYSNYKNHPLPTHDASTSFVKKFRSSHNANWYFGFGTLDSLKKWLCEEDRKLCSEHDHFIHVYKVDEANSNVGISQATFVHHKAELVAVIDPKEI